MSRSEGAAPSYCTSGCFKRLLTAIHTHVESLQNTERWGSRARPRVCGRAHTDRRSVLGATREPGAARGARGDALCMRVAPTCQRPAPTARGSSSVYVLECVNCAVRICLIFYLFHVAAERHAPHGPCGVGRRRAVSWDLGRRATQRRESGAHSARPAPPPGAP